MAASIYFLSLDVFHHGGSPSDYLFEGGCFFLGAAFFFGTFRRSWIRGVAGVAVVASSLCLLGVDVVKWWQGHQTLASVIIVWGVILPGTCLIGFLLDRRQKRLRESEEVFRRLSECSPAGVFLTDAKGSITYTNPRWRTIHGLASGEDAVREWTQMVHPKDRSRVREQWNDCVREGREYEQEFCLQLADGSVRWVYMSASAMHAEHGTYTGHVGTITDITERKQAEEARAHLVQKLITAQEDECRRVSVELHDQMGQGLTAMMLGLNALQASKAGNGPDARQLQQLQELVSDLMGRVHRLAWELRPAALDDLGLPSALKRYVEEWSQRSGVAADFHTSGMADQRLQPSVETTFYRVVQEALTNVIKHAHASRVSVLLDHRRDSVLVIVEDNGKGFDVSTVMNSINSSGRLGLLGMQERAMLVGAKFNIESTPGAGTTVFVSTNLEA